MTKVKIMFSVLALCALLFNSCEKENLDELAPQNEFTQTSMVDGHRTCGHDHHMEQLLADPDYRRAHEEKLALVNNMSSVRAACTNPVVLPIAVHYQNISNPDAACLQQLAQTQIGILNADYQGTNSDITNWTNNASGSFPGISNGEACLEFCLATQNHPSGYNLQDGDLAVTINQTNGDNANDWSGYINIFVRANTGVLGYSPLGGSGNGDGVVVDAAAFGSGSGCPGVVPQSPYNLGRTLTHELGHYLLLDHIWGGNGGCNDDDSVNDTPVSNEPYYGCPNIGASSCSSTDLHMSYMDYTNDACMYMFSAGQVARMENYVATNLTNVSGNAASVCGGTPPPSCATPSGAQSSNIGDNTATISWSAANGAVDYLLQVRPQGGSWTDYTTTNTSYNLTGLQTCTDYEFRVRTNCADGATSNFTATATFKTTGCGGGGGGGGGGSDCEVEAINPLTGEVLTDEECIAQVQVDDPYCCDVGWDGICQDAYDECVDANGGGGGGGNECPVEAVNPWNGNPLTNEECIAQVQIDDPYCCEIAWDGLCQKAYKKCVKSGGGFASGPASNKNNLRVHKFNNEVLASYRIPGATGQVVLKVKDNYGNTVLRKALTSREGIEYLDKSKLAGLDGYRITIEYDGQAIQAQTAATE